MTVKATIDHDPQAKRFSIGVPGGVAVLDYRFVSPPSSGEGPTVIDFTHTYVPTELRGQGLAESLVRHGLHWARQQGYEIRASCWYVEKFLR